MQREPFPSVVAQIPPIFARFLKPGAERVSFPSVDYPEQLRQILVTIFQSSRYDLLVAQDDVGPEFSSAAAHPCCVAEAARSQFAEHIRRHSVTVRASSAKRGEEVRQM